MKNKLFLVFCSIYIGTAGLLQINAQEYCQTGTDINIANVISGSIDSSEFQQSKDFVSLLGANFGTNYRTNNLENRVSISNWSAGSGIFVQYNFPSEGQNYATSISDILSYINSSRLFRGGTDVYSALLRAREWVNQNLVSGRDVPKVIVSLTYASCEQVASNISSHATQIKNQGVRIVVLGKDNATGYNNLSGTNVVSTNSNQN